MIPHHRFLGVQHPTNRLGFQWMCTRCGGVFDKLSDERLSCHKIDKMAAQLALAVRYNRSPTAFRIFLNEPQVP